MSLAVDESLRRALSSAQRALDERSALVKKLQEEAAHGGRAELAKNWARRSREFDQEARVIKDAMQRLDRMVAQTEPDKTAAE